MKKNKDAVREYAVFVLVFAVGIMLILLRQVVADGIKNALTVSGEVLIPSLFPFMVLSAFAVESSATERVGHFFAPLMRKIFRLSGECFSVLFFGFTGGYPVGMSIASGLYEKGLISEDDVRHLSYFCVNAGPAFIVIVAGDAVSGSRKAGIIMLISTVAASLITGIASSFFKKYTITKKEFLQRKTELSTALVNAVKSSVGNILSVCSWVILFSVVISLLYFFIKNETMQMIFSSLAEVTTGVTNASELGGLPFASACISFGGLSVTCQLLPIMKKCKVKAKMFLLFRIVNAVLSYLITRFILSFVNVEIGVFAADARFFSNNAPASAALLIMSALFVYDLTVVSRRKT